MKPKGLKTKIFLDSGDPEETKEALKLLGFLDGQTTNPSLIAKNPETQGKKFTKAEILKFYKEVVREISNLIPDGSVSIEVYADKNTTSDEMLEQGREMFSWIPNPSTSLRAGAHIKFPTTYEGLNAANEAVKQNMRVNMTLVFSQEQAAAVYSATIPYSSSEQSELIGINSSRQTRTISSEEQSRLGFKDVFVSPFIGRLDDRGENGMDLIVNIMKMYDKSDHHVEVLTASVRNLNHFLEAIKLGSDIITSPLSIIKQWADTGMKLPDEDFTYDSSKLKPIPYQKIDLDKDWKEYDIKHELTDIGIDKFSDDWNSLIK